jgi:hypothetical protein
MLRQEAIDDPLTCGDSRQLPLFDPELLPLPPAAADGQCRALTSPRGLAELERRWRRVFAAPKPMSTRLAEREHEQVWLRDDWLDFLEANPSPMFLHFEYKTGFPITHDLVRLLTHEPKR